MKLLMPICKHRESSGSTVRLSVSPDVCCQGAQTDSDDIFSEARFLFDNCKVHYCAGLPVCEMLRLAFGFVLGSFFGGKKRAFYRTSLIIVLLKLKLYLGFLDIGYRLGVPVAIDSQKVHEILDLIKARLQYFMK